MEKGPNIYESKNITQKYEEDLEDKISDNAYSFIDSSGDEYWDEYSKIPAEIKLDVFSDKSIEVLKKYSTTERLFIIARSINNNLLNSPDKAEKYFSIFPEDKRVIIKIAELITSPGTSGIQKTSDISIATLGMGLKYGSSFPEEKKEQRGYHEGEYDYWIKSDRLNKAKNVVVGDGSLSNSYLSNYGELGNKLSEKLDEAEELNTHNIEKISTENLFDQNFDVLLEEDKKNILTKYLATLHNTLLFGEIWNSCFSEESVDRMNKMTQKTTYDHHNVAHSMIYRTYQQNSIYKDKNKGFFSFEMDSPFDTGQGVEEYAFHKLIIATLEKTKELKENKEEIVDFIVDFWNKSRNPIFGPYVAEVLSKLDPDYASSKLLDMVYKEKKDKNPLSSILYRLEFGKIGISSEGVKYLEKMYDLGEFNNEKYSVERLTPKGEMGIFNEEEKLIKYFELGDITKKEDSAIKAQVLDFVYETLFLPKLNETNEEREHRLEYLKEFTEKYHKLSQDRIFKDTGVYLNNLTFQEQGSFIFYLDKINKKENNNINTPEKDELINFVKKYHESGMRTFLSIEQGGEEMGGKILSLGEKLPESIASAVFIKYGEIVDAVNNTENEVKKIYEKENIPSSVYESIKDVLFKEGVELLLKISDDINKEEKIEERKILEDLEEIKTNTIILGSSYVELYKEGIKVPIEDITQIEEVSIKDISDKEREKLLQDYKNGRSKTESENPELMNILEKEFEDELSNRENTLFVVRFDGDIIISAVVDKKDKNTLYIGGLTFVDEVRNPAIGVSAMESVLKRFSGYKIQALVAAKNPIFRMYEKRFGFKIVKKLDSPEELKENAGELYYEIERPKENKEKSTEKMDELEKAA